MKFLLGRNQDLHHGLTLSDIDGNPILRIDGKKNDNVPALILGIDPHIIYGLSHPSVMHRIMHSQEPDILYIHKSIAHKIFEHGMKACWGTVQLGSLNYLATMDTFYKLLYEDVISEKYGINILVHTHYAEVYNGSTKYILSNNNVFPKIDGTKINVSLIRDYLELEFNEPEVNTTNNSGARCS